MGYLCTVSYNVASAAVLGLEQIMADIRDWFPGEAAAGGVAGSTQGARHAFVSDKATGDK